MHVALDRRQRASVHCRGFPQPSLTKAWQCGLGRGSNKSCWPPYKSGQITPVGGAGASPGSYLEVAPCVLVVSLTLTQLEKGHTKLGVSVVG